MLGIGVRSGQNELMWKLQSNTACAESEFTTCVTVGTLEIAWMFWSLRHLSVRTLFSLVLCWVGLGVLLRQGQPLSTLVWRVGTFGCVFSRSLASWCGAQYSGSVRVPQRKASREASASEIRWKWLEGHI